MNDASNDSLTFDGFPVARLTKIFEDQGTWYADYKLQEHLSDALQKFICFNIERLSEGDFDEAELSQYAEFLTGARWAISKNGVMYKIGGAPLFRGTDLSWVM